MSRRGRQPATHGFAGYPSAKAWSNAQRMHLYHQQNRISSLLNRKARVQKKGKTTPKQKRAMKRDVNKMKYQRAKKIYKTTHK